MTKRLRIGAILLPPALLLASCGTADQPIDTAAESDIPSELADSTKDPGPDTDALPGLPAILKDGCTPTEVSETESDWSEWQPISSIVRESGRMISGTITSISNPRISSAENNSAGGRMDLTFFRIVTVRSNAESLGLSQDPPRDGEEVQIMLIGAGPGFDQDQLCYGNDGAQRHDEIPLTEGDEVLALATSMRSFPMTNPPDELQFLDNGIIGLWKVSPAGLADSATPGFDLDIGSLKERIRLEHSRREIPLEEIPEDDGLSSPKIAYEQNPEPTQTTIPTPPAPGPDAKNTPTIPTPSDIPEG